MIYKRTVNYLSNIIATELEMDSKEKDRIRFGIEIVISSSLSFFGSIILAGLLHNIYLVFLILTFSAILKLIGGGVHFHTVWDCALFSAIIYNIFGLIAKALIPFVTENWLLFVVFSSIFILGSLLLWSPAEVSQNPLADKKKRKLKKLSLLIAGSFLVLVIISFYTYHQKFLILNIGIISGLVFHALNINPVAFKLTSSYFKMKESFVKGG